MSTPQTREPRDESSKTAAGDPRSKKVAGWNSPHVFGLLAILLGKKAWNGWSQICLAHALLNSSPLNGGTCFSSEGFSLPVSLLIPEIDEQKQARYTVTGLYDTSD